MCISVLDYDAGVLQRDKSTSTYQCHLMYQTAVPIVYDAKACG